MEGFSEDDSVVVVTLPAARLEAVPSNRTIRILAVSIRNLALTLAELGWSCFSWIPGVRLVGNTGCLKRRISRAVGLSTPHGSASMNGTYATDNKAVNVCGANWDRNEVRPLICPSFSPRLIRYFRHSHVALVASKTCKSGG